MEQKVDALANLILKSKNAFIFTGWLNNCK